MWWRSRPVLLAAGAVAAFLYANFLLDALLSPDHDWLMVVSRLEVPGEENATLLRVTDVICSAVVILLIVPALWTAPRATSRHRIAGALTIAFAVGGILAAIVPLPCVAGVPCDSPAQHLQTLWHDIFSVASASTLFLGAGFVSLETRHDGPVWLHRFALFTFWIGGIVGTTLFLSFGWADSSSWQTGLTQRLQLICMSIWIYCLAVVAEQAWNDERPRGAGRRAG